MMTCFAAPIQASGLEGAESQRICRAMPVSSGELSFDPGYKPVSSVVPRQNGWDPELELSETFAVRPDAVTASLSGTTTDLCPTV